LNQRQYCAWFDDLATGKAQSMAEIAARENITDNYVGNLIHLAWLAPKQVQLVLDGDPKATSLARTSMLARTSDPWWVDRILMPVIGGAKPLESHYSFETPAPLAKRHRTSAH
jgi:hypothetical protein